MFPVFRPCPQLRSRPKYWPPRHLGLISPPLPSMAPLGPAACPLGPWHAGFPAGPDYCYSPGSHGNTLPLPAPPLSFQTGPGPNNAPSASQWPGHNAPVSVHCQLQEACWVSWPVWHIYNSRFQQGVFCCCCLKKKGGGREGGLWLLLSEYLNILHRIFFFPS